MSKLVSIKLWKKDHVVKRGDKSKYYFYCGRQVNKDRCSNANNKGNYCASCYSLANLGPICVDRENEIRVGSIIRCPREVSETGQLKIVGDQTYCKPNTLQPGTSNWDYLAMMFDPDYPKELYAYFEVTKEEVKKWKELYV